MSNGNWKQQCFDTAKNNGWPICNWEKHCAVIQSQIDTYCSGTAKTPGTPVVQLCSTGIDTECKDGMCWCCCSCFAYDTPIETAPGIFSFIQNIDVGDKVMTTGLGLQWKETEVQYSSGLGPDLVFPIMYYLTYKCEGEEETNEMITTADHLFLMASGKLKPIQHLIPGNKLRQANGKAAEVVFCIAAEYKGGVHHIHTGAFDGKNLDNHLINANGIITTDYMVQLAYSSGKLDPSFLTEYPQNGPTLQVGTATYDKNFGNQAAEDFRNKSELWPPGLKPHNNEMINIPASAHNYFTNAQAKDIMKNAPHSGPDSGTKIAAIKYLFTIYTAFYQDIVYLYDWNNDFPGAYAWNKDGQCFVLFTGGLLRINGLNQEGLSIILSHLIAVHEGKKCTGEADYEAIFMIFRDVWNAELFGQVFVPGLAQIEALFGFVSAENSKEDPEDICMQPALKCRLETYKAAASMFPVPDCSIPKPFSFEVAGAAQGGDLLSVTVMYNHPVDRSTAQTKTNYTLTPDVIVKQARVNPVDSSRVKLTVNALKPGTDYLLKVKNVTSLKGTALNPGKSTAAFHTQTPLNVGMRKAKQ